MLKDEGAIDARDRAVTLPLTPVCAIRAGDACIRQFPQDIVDDGRYAKLTMQFLARRSRIFASQVDLDAKAPGSRTFRNEGSGHSSPRRAGSSARYLGDFLN